MTKYTATWECLDCGETGSVTKEGKDLMSQNKLATLEAAYELDEHANLNGCHRRLARITESEE
jgi:hypothetical protein